MGEVYKARDPRLDRHVAIEVLSSELATDAFDAGSESDSLVVWRQTEEEETRSFTVSTDWKRAAGLP